MCEELAYVAQEQGVSGTSWVYFIHVLINDENTTDCKMHWR
jgi:hypothetical protein